MTRRAWILLTATLWFWLSNLHAQPPAEGAMGVVGNPFEQPVAMTGASESYVLARGKVDSADHEAAAGFAAVQNVSLAVPPDSTPADILRQLRGREVEVVLRVVEPRELQRITR